MSRRKRARGRSSAPARHTGLGFLFWLCLAGIVVAVAVAASAPLRDAVKRISGQDATDTGAPAPRVTVTPITESAPVTTQPTTSTPAQPLVNPGTPAPDPKPASRKTRLFFPSIEEGGEIAVKSVIRSIPNTDSPLRDTLEALLKGPTSGELNLGYLSMIPTEAKLRGVTVRGDTATIDFSEGFRFNSLGLDAMNAQLRQVVYTATEFPTVKRVQVLIEGKKIAYLGTEGVRIDQPLARSSFQK